jgi:hypothetical protein
MRNQNLSGARRVGTAKASIATATTTAFDFGTPNDIDLRTVSGGWPAGCRLLAILHNTTAGTTDTTDWTIQDAPDSSGSIGTPATAVTTVLAGSLSGGTGDQYCVVAITPQSGRPWLRFNLHRASGTTDTVVGTVTLLALPYSI